VFLESILSAILLNEEYYRFLREGRSGSCIQDLCVSARLYLEKQTVLLQKDVGDSILTSLIHLYVKRKRAVLKLMKFQHGPLLFLINKEMRAIASGAHRVIL